MKLDSILRSEESVEFSKLTLSGKILDLGGEKSSHYLRLVQGEYIVTTVNLSKTTGCDVVHNLEETPLPFEDDSYDTVVLNNTLEHIYNAKELVVESVRVLKKGGKIIITVPFLFPVHPSPSDYWRFTEEAIQKMLEDSGMSEIKIQPLGMGVFTVCYHFVERLLPKPFRFVAYFLRPAVRLLDVVTYSIRKKGSNQEKKYYTLGYFIVGTK